MPPSTPPPGLFPPQSPRSTGGGNPEASGRGSVTNPAGQENELPSVATGGLRGVGYAAIILAAGLSSRMIENKLLLPWTDGQAIISQVVSAYVDAGLDPIIVVTGRDAEGVAATLAAYPLTFAHNPDYATGEILSSVKTGLRALPNLLDAAFIQPGDMPCISSAVISRLAAQHEPGFNVAPAYQGQRGHPVLLDRAFWRAMLELPADARPRAVLEGARERLRRVEVDEQGVVMDIDTRAAYERALEHLC